MRDEIKSPMMIYLNEDGVSINHQGQYAAYNSDGKLKYFFGTDDSYLPKRVIFHDTRTKSNPSG